MAKYGMSMCTLGHAGEFRPHGIAVNSLWPRTAIATAALQMIPGVDVDKCRKPEILSDAAYLILTSDAQTTTGNFFIDDVLLAQHGITDLEPLQRDAGHDRLHPGLLRRLNFTPSSIDGDFRSRRIAAVRLRRRASLSGGAAGGLPVAASNAARRCAGSPAVLAFAAPSQNSLRVLRTLRSDNCDESVHEARWRARAANAALLGTA